MCGFCAEHGEGKTWYLLMRNYSDVLLHEELVSDQKEAARVTTRVEWLDCFMGHRVLPATGRANGEEIVARRKAVHFGQVLPIEDAQAVIDIASSID